VIGSYLRALTRWSVRDTLPPGEVIVDVTADPAHLARYSQVCGFPADGPLPPTYPHVLAFPAALGLLTRRDFPLPALGLVHVANRIVQRRPIDPAERLTIRVRPDRLRAEPAGTAVDLLVSAIADDEPVWESVSTYLRRGPRSPGTRRADPPTAGAESWLWDVPAGTGRRYAAVSGDRNPIHLHAVTARAFGFRTAIAHGMWAKARVLAARELPPSFAVDVAFRAPIPLPSSVRLASDGQRFALTTPDGGRTHLSGELTDA